MSRHILFSGCAVEHDRRPARAAMLALSKTLRLDIEESSIRACCGARTGLSADAPDARHLLSPLLAAVDQGQDIVCLSPSCRCALTAHLTELAKNGQATAAGTQSRVPHVRDCVELLSLKDDGLDRLRALPKRLRFLRVALHGTCHGDHNPAQWLAGTQAGTGSPLPGSAVSATALANLVAASGANVLEDVSVSGQCAGASLAGGKPAHTEDAQAAVRCLALAVEAGAEALITPCARCYSDLRRYQRTMDRSDNDRYIHVLHIAQLLDLACMSGPIVWVYGAQQF